MRYIDLGASGWKTSALGFGCSAVMGRVGRRQSLRTLSEAYDAGITFFDTARSYGYGESEALVGEFLQNRRDRVILSTKFGIVPVQQRGWKRSLMPVIRATVDIVPSVRKLIRRQVKAQFKENQLTRVELRRSLEESLRKLRSHYIDILFLHSPSVYVLAQSDLLEDLEKLVESGKIRAVGISAEPEVITAALKAKTAPLTSMQFPVNLFDLSIMRHITAAQSRGLMFIANHPFGGTDRLDKSRTRLGELAASPEVSPELRSKLTSGDEGILSEVILNLIVTDTGIQVVVPSMMKVRHLRANVQAISNCRFTREELAWIRCNLAQTSTVGILVKNNNRVPASL
jgi:aryl-alcohol dehydrogenase-like predicted oxidoreductase